ncbi:MAG: CCA tRNA nucleotidyltransferase [Pirellulales bacterium]|nr:CCA tRNA nucleotidyltransferase [Pirellulales bacterium]
MSLIPTKQRSFAVEVVRQLRDHGYEAYWAGGCVRDQLLGHTPYDFDVATSARPAEIRHVFQHRRTLSIGAAFGVMIVVGPRGAGQVEITTFRQDATYSDGRHPDRVSFSSPEEDAKRRDFTINGMFFDPLDERVIDFVGGEADLQRRTIRAIGDPRQRFAEDKLRMLRAIRFSAILDFQLEPETLAAIVEMASQVTVVSAERIAAEVQIVLVHDARAKAVDRLRSTGLLQTILPEVLAIVDWPRTLALLGSLVEPTFALALAALLQDLAEDKLASMIGRRWKLSRKDINRLEWLLENKEALANARGQRWSKLQPTLAAEGAADLVKLQAAKASLGSARREDVEFCRLQLQRPRDELDPPSLIDGRDLLGLGIPRGPVFARLLQAVRAAQLDGHASDRAGALALVEQLREKSD